MKQLLTINIFLLFSAITLLAQTSATSQKAQQLLEEAQTKTAWRKFDEAITLCQQAADLYQSEQQWLAYYTALYRKINNYLQHNQTLLAYETTQKALADCEKQLKEPNLGHFYLTLNLTAYYSQQQQFEEVARLLENAKKELANLAPSDKTIEAEVALLERFGKYHYAVNQVDLGLSYYQNAIVLHEEKIKKTTPELVNLYLDMGYEKIFNGQTKDALPKDILQAKQLLAQLPLNPRLEYRLLADEFIWYYAKSNKSKIASAQDRVEACLEKYFPNDVELIGGALVNRGASVKDVLGDYVGSISYFQKAVALFEKNPPAAYSNTYAMALLNLGQAYFDTGNNEASKPIWKKLLQLLLPQYPSIEDDTEIDFKNPNFICYNAQILNKVLYIQSILEKDTCIQHQVCANYHHKKQQQLDAIDYIYRAAISDKDMLAYANAMNEVFLIEYFITLKTFEKNVQPVLDSMFRNIDKQKAFLLRQTIDKEKAFEIAGVPTTTRQSYFKLKLDIKEVQNRLQIAQKESNKTMAASLQQNLLVLHQQESEWLHQLEKKYTTYQKITQHRPIATTKEVQQHLDSDMAMVHYHARRGGLLSLFVIMRDTCFYWDVEHQADWNKLVNKEGFDVVQSLLQSLTDASFFTNNPEKAYREFIQKSHLLYQTVWGFDAVLQAKKIKQVVIVPHEYLFYIPFEILIRQLPTDTVKPEYGKLDYLLRHYAISYTPSATFWLDYQQKKPAAASGKVLGFAPHYPSGLSLQHRSPSIQKMRAGLVELPGAKQELTRLREQFAGDYFFGEDANEQQFKKASFANYSVLHLAMHGLLDIKNPNQSALALSETKDTIEDNFLHAYEVAQLPIPCELVVLSACETGIGDFETSEGLMSLGRFFLYAGTPSIVMTRWSVNDGATAYIMEFFYKNLYNGMSKNEALRQAQLSYLDNTQGTAQHPFFWAAPFLMGNTHSIQLYSNSDIRRNTYLWWGGIGAGLLLLLGLAWRFLKKKQ